MTKSLIVSPKTAKDIDSRIDRVLKGLGYPEPPLRLEDVRELLRLDLRFYTADNPGYLQEVTNRIFVGTKQVFQRPALLMDAISKLSLQALYLPDRKRILLDDNVPKLKHRWNEAHEIGHSLLPWHQEMMHGDDENTLSQHCHEHIELEANFAAARLLFLRDRFTEEARAMAEKFASIKSLQTAYGNTLSTTLYRFVECIGTEKPVVGVISGHPHISKRTDKFDAANPCRHFIQSPAFAQKFSNVSELEVFKSISAYCGRQGGGILGEDEVFLEDDNGQKHIFRFETFYNRYDCLTLGVHLAPAKSPIFF
ncbi:ImmA/IrrE family metallo-endopeptidase [Pseudomonas sp. DY-1]|uniref:ImmA/IrrE family metallo-endopeptidase n=1 Tax=Pseudomonas sp. DY-1 TaxID=1755504 RepID=UPI000EA8459F|nr:ImmA/IrrE family metallo-endopeptidase [Pseudomonas sp. DY-1]AYF88163.1 ImmA/IrrE family metallo-endopeptidase [Pseudomonas sp. DY-1]